MCLCVYVCVASCVQVRDTLWEPVLSFQGRESSDLAVSTLGLLSHLANSAFVLLFCGTILLCCRMKWSQYLFRGPRVKELLTRTFSCLWQLKVAWVLFDYLFGYSLACVFETILCGPGWPSTHDAANTGPWAPNPPTFTSPALGSQKSVSYHTGPYLKEVIFISKC